MNSASFRLDPFPGEDALTRIAITGSIDRSKNGLALRFLLTGEISQIEIPALSDAPERKNGLWEQTCFELFLAPKGSRIYWECNLSPAGDWNVYHFSDYRQGMREETAVASLPFRVDRRGDCLSLFPGVEFDRDR